MRLPNYLIICLAVLTITVGTAFVAPNAHAATITVNSTDQESSGTQVNGNCTLSEAIDAANKNSQIDACTAGSGADVIVLAAGATYSLTQAHAKMAGYGLLDISSDIEIQGNGATIQRDPNAGSDFSILIIGGKVVKLSNLTIQNGKANASLGVSAGAINTSAGSTLTLDQVKILNNIGTDAGAILAVNSSTTIKGCTFKDNTTSLSHGGALNLYYGTVTISGSTFQSNQAKKGGGAIYLMGNATINSITDSYFIQNTTDGSGGAIYNLGTKLLIASSSFVGNTATTNTAAILNASSANLEIKKSLFKDNSTPAPGGSTIANVGNALLFIHNSTITGNTGGGIYVPDGSNDKVRIINNTITNNTDGDGIILYTNTLKPTVINNIILGNLPKDCTTFDGEQVNTFSDSSGHNLTDQGGGCPVLPGDYPVTGGFILSNFISTPYAGGGFFRLLPESAAIDHGEKCVNCPDYDQLGEARNLKYDMGSIEAGCGDALVHTELGEICDDGNAINGDGCSDACKAESGYSCSGSPSVCKKSCGDGTLDVGEQCDDGNSNNGDGCSDSCTAEGGYACFTDKSPTQCLLVCGNGQMDGGTEKCDDNNKVSGDGCSATCQPEAGYTCNGFPSVCTGSCGNGKVELGEKCDDNNTNDYDGCSATCTIDFGYACSGDLSLCKQICGDGYMLKGESCDDGNKVNGDGCSSDCKTEPGYFCYGYKDAKCEANCGDFKVFLDEECDEGGQLYDKDNTDDCLNTCKKAKCGDGYIHAGVEACEGTELGGKTCASIGLGFDGGTLSCKDNCTLDTTLCTASPKASCGDGKINGPEACDKSDLGGKTCANINEGFEGGVLICKGDCTIDMGSCTKPITITQPDFGGIDTKTPPNETAGSTSSSDSTTPAPTTAAPASGGGAGSGGGGGCSLMR